MKGRNILIIALMLVPVLSQAQTTVHVTVPGRLSEGLTREQQDTCTRLKVVGALNSSDIRLLRRMGGYNDGTNEPGVMSHLDLSDATFVTDKAPYMVLDARKECLAATALPGKIRDYEYILGKTAIEKVGINYNRYNDIFWRYPSYLGRRGIMMVRGRSIPYYFPQFYLGHAARDSMNVGRYVFEDSDRLDEYRRASWAQSQGQYFFSGEITRRDWKEIRRRRITNIAGYRLTKEKDGYCLSAHMKKGIFSHGMFYGCENLQTVTMPRGMRPDYSVTDESTQTMFLLPELEVTITYYLNQDKKPLSSSPEDKDGFVVKRSATLSGVPRSELGRRAEKLSSPDGITAKKMAGILEGLTRMKNVRTHYSRLRAEFLVEYPDGREAEIYYLFADNEHVLRKRDGKYYRASTELVRVMTKLKII